MSEVTIREVPIEQAIEVANTVTDFGETYDSDYFEKRYQDHDRLIIVGYVNGQPAGFIVAYDRDQDGSFYCWMAGVNPKFRRQGVLTALMNYQAGWAKARKYKSIRIKTRNTRREMLANLVSKGFLFIAVDARPDPQDNRITLEKSLVS